MEGGRRGQGLAVTLVLGSHTEATHLQDLWEQGLKMAEMGCA